MDNFNSTKHALGGLKEPKLCKLSDRINRRSSSVAFIEQNLVNNENRFTTSNLKSSKLLFGLVSINPANYLLFESLYFLLIGAICCYFILKLDLKKVKFKKRPKRKVVSVFTGLTLMFFLFIVSLLDLCLSLNKSDNLFSLEASFEMINLLSFFFYSIIISALQVFSNIMRTNNKDFALLVMPISVILLFIDLRLRTIDGFGNSNYYSNVVKIIKIILLVAQIILQNNIFNFLDNRPKNINEESLQDKSNLYEKLVFSWLNPLLALGFSRTVLMEDLNNLPKGYEVNKVTHVFDKNWKSEQSNNANGLMKSMCKSFGMTFLFAGILKFVQDSLGFIQPQLLKLLINFIEEYTKKDKKSKNVEEGITIALMMFGVGLIQTSILHQYFQLCVVVGMKLKTCLTTSIYKKALNLNNSSKKKYSTGEIVNHMSIDTQRIQDLCTYLHVAWSGLWQISLSLYFLHKAVGNAMFAGVILMVIAIPINIIIGSRLRKLQGKLLEYKDHRIKKMDEFLSSIKVIKLYSWEKLFTDKINKIRNNNELSTLKKYGIIGAFSTFSSASLPMFVSLLTFSVYSLFQKKTLEPSIVFVSISLFNMLQFPLNVLPFVLTSMVEASVSIKRIKDFLSCQELDKSNSINKPMSKDNFNCVEIKNVSFSWDDSNDNNNEDDTNLKNIEVQFQKKQLIGIIGKVGSGKSSLLSAILGEMKKIGNNKNEENVITYGSIAYVPQQAWILNGTVKENILFGNEYHEELYLKTISSCELEKDFEILNNGDMTVIGEKGITLSGGQKTRISLARAVYQRADIYLLDDPLAAVDSFVAKKLFNKVLSNKGILKNKSRILVSNSSHFFKRFDYLVAMQNGRIIHKGPYNELKMTTTEAVKELLFIDKTSNDHNNPQSNNSERRISVSSFSSNNETQINTKQETEKTTFNNAIQQTFNEESKEGNVSLEVYKYYIAACSITGSFLFVFLALLSQGGNLSNMLYLKSWSQQSENKQIQNDYFNVAILSTIAVFTSIVTFLQYIIQTTRCVIPSATKSHNKMLSQISRAKMTFFDTTPMGRIINRFSKDQSVIDEQLPRSITGYSVTLVKVSFIIIVILVTTPLFAFVLIFVALMYRRVQKYYLTTSRELKRLDSTSRSPLYTHFQESVNGASSIKAYNHTKRFINQNEQILTNNLKAYYPTISLNRWLGIRLEFLGSLIIFSSAIMAVITIYLDLIKIDPGLVGLSVSYALSVTQSLNWCIRQYCEIEINIISVERIKEYMELPTEAQYEYSPQTKENTDALIKPSEKWPQNGAIKFVNYSAMYREDLKMVLKNINIEIMPRQKIGIVGRTGAGKSSLTMALFRIIEASKGKIIIDDIDISKLALYDLRHRLSIIPQDPVLFNATIRENVDPFNEYSDDYIWNALYQSNLFEHVKQLPQKLEFMVSQNGTNFSQGQKQLICLTRALLKRTSVIVLDEATAAIDHHTDNIIQKTINNEFRNCTIITIAHRINTVINNDKIISLENGEVVEFDSPQALLNKKDGLFYNLASEAGLIQNND